MKAFRPFLAIASLALALIGQAQEHLVDVVYGHKMGVALTMDVFQPAKPNGIGIIWVVSGGWVSNHANINPALAKAFNDRGMTVFEVVHGSQPKFQIPDILLDMHRSIRFIRTNAAKFHVDPNRIGISGASAGGHLSLMMGAYGGPGNPEAKDPVDRASSEVEAVACFFPPTDMLNYGGPGIRPFKQIMMRPFWPAFGVTDKTPDEDLEKMAKEFSPIYGVTAKMPPTFIMHGDADFLVPLQQSQIFMAKLDELKIPHELVVKAKGSHGWADMDKDLPKLADWFEKYLGKK
jgi:acetyl esterase/lipase